MIVTQTTYDPDGNVYAHSVIPIRHPFHGDVAGTMAWKLETGWTKTGDRQVQKVDERGFVDVVTYEEDGEL